VGIFGRRGGYYNEAGTTADAPIAAINIGLLVPTAYDILSFRVRQSRGLAARGVDT
jgi:hypothetical protein